VANDSPLPAKLLMSITIPASTKFREILWKCRNSVETGKFRGSAQNSAYRGKMWSLTITHSQTNHSPQSSSQVFKQNKFMHILSVILYAQVNSASYPAWEIHMRYLQRIYVGVFIHTMCNTGQCSHLS